MKCPTCQTDLMISDRQGIEIHCCPQCRGVWLDRGELDELIERASRYGGDDDDDDRRYRSDQRPEYSRNLVLSIFPGAARSFASIDEQAWRATRAKAGDALSRRGAFDG
jgi:hypothetical protein